MAQKILHSGGHFEPVGAQGCFYPESGLEAWGHLSSCPSGEAHSLFLSYTLAPTSLAPSLGHRAWSYKGAEPFKGTVARQLYRFAL